MDLTGVLRALELAGLSGIRSSWVLVATSLAGALGYLTFPDGVSWLGTWPGVGAMAVFALIEHFSERDTDLIQVLRAVQTALAATTAVLTTGALARAEQSLHVGIPVWAVQVVAVLVAVTTIGVRHQVKLKLMELSANAETPSRWVARAEEGGLVAGGTLVVLSPVLLAATFVACGLAVVGLVLAFKELDRQARRACGGCGALARREAQRCPKCHAALSPEVVLSLPIKLSVRLATVTQQGTRLLGR